MSGPKEETTANARAYSNVFERILTYPTIGTIYCASMGTRQRLHAAVLVYGTWPDTTTLIRIKTRRTRDTRKGYHQHITCIRTTGFARNTS